MGFQIQAHAELLESLNNARGGIVDRISDRLLDFRKASMKANRAESSRTANQIRKKSKGERRSKKSLINQEIDTDEDWACRNDS